MFDNTIVTIFSLIILLFSVIIHELAHGYVANSLGDPTAKYAGRLTINPIKHLDLLGSIILPLSLYVLTSGAFAFGWAKPVPINPYNFKDKKFGELKVSTAGPISNLLLAIIFGLIIRFVLIPYGFYDFFTRQTQIGNFNFFAFVVEINIWLAVFNLIPIPPLDGSWILFTFLPARMEKARAFLRQYGIVILVLLILFSGPLWSVITNLIFQLITGHALTL